MRTLFDVLVDNLLHGCMQSVLRPRKQKHKPSQARRASSTEKDGL